MQVDKGIKTARTDTKVLVIGGRGFIGSNLFHELQETGL